MATNDAVRDGDPLDAQAVGTDDVILDQTFELSNLVALRAAVAAHAADAGLGGSRVAELVLVAHELASNAVRHGGGHGRLRLWVAEGFMYCQVTDQGPGLPGAQPAKPWRPPVDAVGGRGLWLAHHLSDRFVVRAGPDGTVATATIAMRGAVPADGNAHERSSPR
jgi:serine/threonine-protein kinase RsbW